MSQYYEPSRPYKPPLRWYQHLLIVFTVWAMVMITVSAIHKNYKERLSMKDACSLDKIQAGNKVLFSGELREVKDVTKYSAIGEMSISLKDK